MHQRSSAWSQTGAAVSACLLGIAALVANERAIAYVQVNLVSDIPGLAANTDPNLKNPWGIASSPTSPFWVADNHTGLSTLYNGAGVPQPQPTPLIVTIPPPGSGTPTGTVFNGTSSFEVAPSFAARFLFAAEDGSISGWNPGAAPTNALVAVPPSATSSYKGLAIGNNGSGNFLYAADFLGGQIDVFDGSFGATTLGGNFTDPNLPANYAPFNIQALGGKLYVTYALNEGTGEETTGPGLGLVDVFDFNGSFVQRLITDGALNAPWGLAIAPPKFGEFSNDLLVGNFGDGRINAYDPATGAFLGALSDPNGNPIEIEGLWGLRVGNGGNGGDPNTVYFAAGINDEANGLFGALAVPEPAMLSLLGFGLVAIGFARRVPAASDKAGARAR